MTNAQVVVTGRGRARLVYAIDGEEPIEMKLKVSRLPNWFDRPGQNIVAIVLLFTAHLSKELRDFLVMRLAEILAHEWRHVWQTYRYGRVGFALMAIWRVITKGYRRSDLEADGDAFGAAHAPYFVAAAATLLSSGFFDDAD